MNRLGIRLSDGKRFVCSSAMAAVLVLLAGGANALANTVWTVSKTSSNATCSASATTCNTIGSAVSAASWGDVIVVGPGTYNESVSIVTSYLSLFGAQAGKDARGGRYGVGESVVDATNQTNGPGHGAAFWVSAANVVIDGFTIQGGILGDNASGIYLAGLDGTQILNNIIQNNSVGVYLYQAGYALVEFNLFKTNNKATAGMGSNVYVIPGPGFGIAADYVSGDSIAQNAFEGNLAGAIFLYDSNAMQINHNASNGDGSFVIIYYCNDTFFDHNIGQNFGVNGFRPVSGETHADAAVDFLFYNYNIQIYQNDLERGPTPGYNGIAFSNMTTGAGAPYLVCEYCQVSDNTIMRFAGNGIVAEPEPNASNVTLTFSLISRNDVEENGNVGILIELAPYNYYNTLFENKAEGNQLNDCEDDNPGSLTAGTNNTWFNNIGSLSSPAGLCTPRFERVFRPVRK